jgi:hypothetical protein
VPDSASVADEEAELEAIAKAARKRLVSLVIFPVAAAVVLAAYVSFINKKYNHVALLQIPELVDVSPRSMQRRSLADAVEVKAVIDFIRVKQGIAYMIASTEVMRMTNVIRVVSMGRTRPSSRKALDLLLADLTKAYEPKRKLTVSYQQKELSLIDKKAKQIESSLEKGVRKQDGEGSSSVGGNLSLFMMHETLDELSIQKSLLSFALDLEDNSRFCFIDVTEGASKLMKAIEVGFVLGFIIWLIRIYFLELLPAPKSR